MERAVLRSVVGASSSKVVRSVAPLSKSRKRSTRLPRTVTVDWSETVPSGFVRTSEMAAETGIRSRSPCMAHSPPFPTSLDEGQRNASTFMG